MSGNGELTGYRVCYSDKASTSNPRCCRINAQYSTVVITNLRPATKYFVTVAAGTSVGFGPKSTEISAITNGGETSSLQFVRTTPTSMKTLGHATSVLSVTVKIFEKLICDHQKVDC